MKKLIVTTLATAAVALGAYAQGSIGGVTTMFNNDGITTPGANSSNPNLAAGSLYYTGNANVELYYASTAQVTAAQITAINTLDGTTGGGAAALALLTLDGFTLASTTTLTGSTAGSLAYVVNDGGLAVVGNPDTIGLTGVPTSTAAWIAMYVVGSGGTFNNYSGVLAFAQNTGGNPTTTPAGTASVMANDPQGLNLVLTTAVPEPSTMALAGLGGLAALLFRRKK